MQIQIKEIKEDLVQITTLDERWYQVGDKFIPSVTWISGHYPKGIQFYKWLASKGWDEAEAIKNAAGDKGSKVHNALEDLANGKEVKMDDKYLNPTTEEMEELSVEEYDCVISFADWWKEMSKEHKMEVVATESVVVNKKVGYAGTLDLRLLIDGESWIIDFKTSANIWPEFELQISAYKHCGLEDSKLGILQVGYKRNKRGWKFNEVEDKFDLFLHAKAIWHNENDGVEPKQKDYPKSVKLEMGKAVKDK